jgi:hypothetical protein
MFGFDFEVHQLNQLILNFLNKMFPTLAIFAVSFEMLAGKNTENAFCPIQFCIAPRAARAEFLTSESDSNAC